MKLFNILQLTTAATLCIATVNGAESTVGSIATLTDLTVAGGSTSFDRTYNPPKSFATAAAYSAGYAQCRTEYKAIRKALSHTNRGVRAYTDALLAELNTIEGIVPGVDTIDETTGQPMSQTARLRAAITKLMERNARLASDIKSAVDAKEEELKATHGKELAALQETLDEAKKAKETWKLTALIGGGAAVGISAIIAVLARQGRLKISFD